MPKPGSGLGDGLGDSLDDFLFGPSVSAYATTHSAGEPKAVASFVHSNPLYPVDPVVPGYSVSDFTINYPTDPVMPKGHDVSAFVHLLGPEGPTTTFPTDGWLL